MKTSGMQTSWHSVECSRCWKPIDEADSDIMYLDGCPVCNECFNEFWTKVNKKLEEKKGND